MTKEIEFSSPAIELILNIEFFKNCGNESEVSMNQIQAFNKIHAEKFALSNAWRDYREKQGNILSEYLHNKDIALYSKYWNENVVEFNQYWGSDIQDQLILKLSEANLNPKILVKVQWDLLHYVQTQSFSPLLKSQKAPKFFNDLFEIYKQGHLPCGVTNYLDFENPKILVY